MDRPALSSTATDADAGAPGHVDRRGLALPAAPVEKKHDFSNQMSFFQWSQDQFCVCVLILVFPQVRATAAKADKHG